MASITVTISGLARSYQDVGLAKDSPKLIASAVDGVIWGALIGALQNSNPSISVAYSSADAVHASQTYTLSGTSGTLTFTIGGTGVTASSGASDTASAVAAVTAINANTTVNKLVVASSSGATVTVKALVPGTVGNKITTTASGTGNTAGGATLTGGAGADTFLLQGGAL